MEPIPRNSHERTSWHTLDAAEVEARLRTGATGLTADEAARRLALVGPNRLEEAPPPSALAILLHQFTSPLIYILLLATGVTLLLREFIDAGVIAAVLVLNAVIGFSQERNAEQAVRSLMRLVEPQARVIRDGEEREQESRTLVPGDLVLLESGNRVPADLRLVSAAALTIDEALLTGESVPVVKRADRLDCPDLPLGDRANMAYAGSVVARGRGRGYIVATGMATELGAIAGYIRREEQPRTPLQHRMDRFARLIGIAVVVSAVAAFGSGVLLGGSVSEMFLVAVALAVSAVPEGLPVVLTIALAVGVRRMARRQVIIRRLPAVETLGSTNVIGTDKTGTLTENRMTVQRIWAGGEAVEVAPSAGGCPPDGGPIFLALAAGVVANEAKARRAGEELEVGGDPTEVALLVAAERMGCPPDALRAAFPVEVEIPFEPDRQYSAALSRRDGEPVLFVKGAPERVLAMCGAVLTREGPAPLDLADARRAVQEMANAGLRVLAMAYSPGTVHGLEDGRDPDGLTLLGLQAMHDPPRPGVPEAVAGCQGAGIKVVMITGDHAATARHIASAVGIGAPEAPVLTGADLDGMDDEDLARRVREVSVYARVSPEHKLRVVRAFRGLGDIVAVTGDGVNDAPALRAADIGIAMGRSGTDVAREASDMVLTDDNFVSIHAAVEEGRITFDNVRKVTFFLISTGAAEVAAILLSLVMRWPLPLLPAQILWLNLVTNGLQDVALALEPGEPGVLRRPPRRPAEGIVSRLLWERTVLSGMVLAAGTLLLFWDALRRTGSLDLARTVALTTMVVFQMFQAGNARSDTRSVFRISPLSNPFLLLAVAAALALHVAALYLPPTQFVLRLEPIPPAMWPKMAAVAASILVAVEAHKLARRRWPNGRKT